MDHGQPRFECMRENGATWMVWDHLLEAVAELDGCSLKGKDQNRARCACSILTAVYKDQLAATSVREAARRDLIG